MYLRIFFISVLTISIVLILSVFVLLTIEQTNLEIETIKQCEIIHSNDREDYTQYLHKANSGEYNARWKLLKYCENEVELYKKFGEK